MTQQQLASQIEYLGNLMAYYDRRSRDAYGKRDLSSSMVYRDKALELERQAAQAISIYFCAPDMGPEIKVSNAPTVGPYPDPANIHMAS